jgi:AraC-like DNA-binding protein
MSLVPIGRVRYAPAKEDILEVYNQPGGSLATVCAKFKLSRPTMARIFDEYNIIRKTASQITLENQQHKDNSNLSDDQKCLNDKQWLTEQLLIRTVPHIAKELNVSSTTVRRHAKEFGIECDGRRGDATTTKMLADRAWLLEQYVTNGSTLASIAEQLGSSAPTVLRWINIHGISR